MKNNPRPSVAATSVVAACGEGGQSGKNKDEAKRVLCVCGAKNYRERLDKELKAIHDSEMWQAGAASRSLRPKGKAKDIAKGTKGVGGRGAN